MKKLIDQETERELKERFKRDLKEEVDIKIFMDDIVHPDNPDQKEYNDFAMQFISELNNIDPKIKFERYTLSHDIAKELNLMTSPTILLGYNKGYKIIYNGAPLGYEASGFLETITLISRGESGLSNENKKLLAEIDKDTKIQVFVTPSCPYCPSAVLLSNRIAIEGKGKISSECVESYENQKLAQLYNVSSVPQQVINGDIKSVTIGVQPEKNFVFQVLKYASSKYEEILKEYEEDRKKKEKLVDNPEEVIILTDANFTDALKKYSNLVVDCWAEWCMPCKMISPIIDKLSQKYKGKIIFGKLNVDENQNITSEYDIMSIPTLLVFKNGEKKGEVIGALPENEIAVSYTHLTLPTN